ncbi:MAG: hypothetical protein GWP17_04050 [Aquificales bacterium]|nr:hypothetical protein [Aquificales bacterium]
MTKRSSVLFGLLLIFLGIQAFFYQVFLPLFGLETGNGRLWPLFVANIGILLVLAPFLVRRRRGLGALFIPGVPIVVTSGILLLASITDWWGMWQYMWPLVIIAFALGFVAAAAWTRIVWFLIPATIIGANGLVFLFCAVTDLWEVWAAMWPVELLSIGLSLLLVNFWVQSKGLFTAGIILSVLAGFGFALMALVLTGWVSVIAALVLVGTGLLLLGRNVLPELTGGELATGKSKLSETYTEEDVVRIKEAG